MCNFVEQSLKMSKYVDFFTHLEIQHHSPLLLLISLGNYERSLIDFLVL